MIDPKASTDTEHDRLRRIRAITKTTPLSEVIQLVAESFRVHFGPTSDERRLRDIALEAAEFCRALTRPHRIEEYGDLLASLIAFAAEQDVDPIEALKETLLKIERRADVYAVRGDKKSVVIFGGSFDCPQNGHVAAARAVLDAGLGIEEIWFMPACGYMGSKVLTEAPHRAAMCRLLEQIDPRFRFFGYEIDHHLSSETLQTLLRISQEPFADQHRFFFLVGSDVANGIPRWRSGSELMRAATFITLPRSGYPIDHRNPWYLQHPHIYLGNVKPIDLSSTRVRTLYREGRFDQAAALVPPAIDAYIHEHKLYDCP